MRCRSSVEVLLIALMGLALSACGGGGSESVGASSAANSSAGSSSVGSSSASSVSSSSPIAAPTGLSYSSPQTYAVGQAITALNPTVTGTVSSYTILPALPAGLTLNATSGQIAGTPTAITAQANYIVTAGNVSGSTTFSLSLTITAPPKFTLGAYTSRSVAGSVPTNAPFLGFSQFFDLDGDGWGDLIWAGAYYPFNGNNPTPQAGYVAFNGPSGFTAAVPSKFPYANMLTINPREFSFTDFNGDGILDLFIADHGYDAPPFPGYQNRLYLSQSGSASWTDATTNLPQLSDFTHSVCTGDVNGDSKVDIFVGNGGLAQAYFLRGDGTGHFAQDSLILPINAGQDLQNANVGFTSCSLVDLDGDGRPELVLGTGYQSRTTQILWNDHGSYATDTIGASTISALPWATNLGAGSTIYEIQATDLNGDGKQDLILIYNIDVAYGGWQIQFLVNQGNHQFIDQTTTYLPDATTVTSGAVSASTQMSWIAFLVPRDLNGDGLMDYWVEANPQAGRLNDNLPLALIRQANGSFIPVKVGELRAAGMPDSFFYFVGYESRGASLPGELVQAFADSSANNQIKINAQAITFH
jgi:hypothetical protein